jgi:hypothetical protein
MGSKNTKTTSLYEYPNSYREVMYDGRGLSGLSTADRAQWENKYKDLLDGKSEGYKKAVFEIDVFNDIVRNSKNPEYRKLVEGRDPRIQTSEGRREILDMIAINEDVDGRSDLVEEETGGLLGSMMNAAIEGAEASSLGKASQFLFNPRNPAKALMEHEIQEQQYKDALAEWGRQERKIEEKFKAQFQGKKTARQLAQERIDAKAATKEEGYRQGIELLSPEQKDKVLHEFDDMSTAISSQYANYKNSRLALSGSEREDLFAKYNAWAEVGGSDYANSRLSDEYENILAKRQSAKEKAANAVESFGESFTAGTASTIGAIAGVGIGLYTNAELLLSDNYDNLTPEQKNALRISSFYSNEITEWADRLMTTGVWDKETQLKYAELGLRDNPIFKTVKEQEQLLSWSSAAEVTGSMGFTTSAMLTSMAGSGLINFGARKAKAAAIKNLNSYAAKAAKLSKINKNANTARLTVPLMVTAGEASLEAVGAKNEAYDSAIDGAVNQLNSEIDSILINTIQNNPKEMHALLDKYSPEYASLLKETNPAGSILGYSSATKEQIYEILSNNPELRKSIGQTINYDERIADAKNKATQISAERGAVDLLVNYALLGAINYGAQLSMQAPSVRKAVQARKAGSNRFDELKKHMDFTTVDGKPLAKGKLVEYQQILKERGKEIISEGFEEGGQGLSTEYNKRVAESYLEDYVRDRYRVNEEEEAVIADAANALEDLDRRFQAFHAGLSDLGYITTSKDNIREALYGALGTAFGSPIINTSVRWGKKNANQSTWNYVSNLLPITWRSALNPFNVKSDAQERTKENELMAEYVNMALEDPNAQEALGSAVGMMNFIKTYNDALDDEDEKKIRDARLKGVFNFISILQSMEGSTYATGVKSIVENRKNLNEEKVTDTTSEEHKILLDYAMQNNLNVENMTEDEQKEVITRVKHSAKEFSQMMDTASKQLAEYDKIFGSEVSMEAKHAILYNDFLIKDTEERGKQINDIITNIVNTIPPTSTSSLSPAAKTIKAIYGSVEGAEKTKKELEESITRATEEFRASAEQFNAAPNRQNHGKMMLMSQLLGTAKSKLAEIEKLLKESKSVSKEEMDNAKISDRDILELPDEYRAIVFRKYRTAESRKSAQGKAVQDAIDAAAIHNVNNLETLVKDAATLRAENEGAKRAKVEYLSNPGKVQQLTNKVKSEAAASITDKKYNYLADPDSESNASYESFIESVLNALTDAKDPEEKRAIQRQAEKSSFFKQLAAESEIHKEFVRKVTNSEVYKKAPSRLQEDVAALFNTIYKKGTIIDLDNYTEGTLESAISNLSQEEIETNWKRETDNSYQMTDLGAAITLATQAFDSALKDHRKEKERTKPVHVEKVTPEQSTPKKSDTPVVEGPVVEHSKANPTVVLSIEDLLNKGATSAMKDFFEKHKVLDNIIRLINSGKLTTMNPVTKLPTQVYFTVDQIGKSLEIIQIVEDEDGTYIVDGKKYSIIGVETAAKAFTSEERSSDNIGKLLERTASVARIDTQRKTGEATNLKDVDNPETVLSNLTIGERKDSKTPKTEIVYSTKTGKGGTAYTSSVSDTAVDQVPISEGQTAIDILNSFRGLSDGERTALALQFLEKLDYGTSKYVSAKITEAIANQNWDTDDFSTLMQNINSLLSSLYVVGRVAGKAAQFELTKTNDGFTMKLVHPSNKNVSLSTVERKASSEQIDAKIITEMILSALAQASLTTDGKAQKFGKKPFLRFEIGLQDLEVVNRKTPLNVKNEEGLRAAKKKIMMDRIELGILQLPNNDTVLHPKSIELVFNSDGKTNSTNQVTPAPNADFTESRSNTVETTDGEIVDGNTGTVIESAVEKPKVTDIFEQATDEINTEAVVTQKTPTKGDTVETQIEEDEEEISSDDINSSMSQDDEFGSLYSEDTSSSSENKKENQAKVDKLNSSPNALIESWEWLTEEARSRFEKKGITQEVWENMTSEEREKAIECI